MIFFSTVKFTRGNEKNMSSLLIPKSQKVWKESVGIGPGSFNQSVMCLKSDSLIVTSYFSKPNQKDGSLVLQWFISSSLNMGGTAFYLKTHVWVSTYHLHTIFLQFLTSKRHCTYFEIWGVVLIALPITSLGVFLEYQHDRTPSKCRSGQQHTCTYIH